VTITCGSPLWFSKIWPSKRTTLFLIFYYVEQSRSRVVRSTENCRRPTTPPLTRHTHGRSANGNLIFPYYFLKPSYTSKYSPPPQPLSQPIDPLTDAGTQTRRRPRMKCGHINLIRVRHTAVTHVIREYATYILHYGTTIRGVYLPSTTETESIMTLHLYKLPAVYQQYRRVYNSIYYSLAV